MLCLKSGTQLLRLFVSKALEGPSLSLITYKVFMRVGLFFKADYAIFCSKLSIEKTKKTKKKTSLF